MDVLHIDVAVDVLFSMWVVVVWIRFFPPSAYFERLVQESNVLFYLNKKGIYPLGKDSILNWVSRPIMTWVSLVTHFARLYLFYSKSIKLEFIHNIVELYLNLMHQYSSNIFIIRYYAFVTQLMFVAAIK